MEATVSLSKGVFAFKKPKSGIKKISNDNSCIDKYWRQEEGRDDPDVRRLTLENYQIAWTTTRGVIKELLDSIHSKVFEDLVAYVKRVGFSQPISSNVDCKPDKCVSSNLDKDIPSACLVTGVNMPDHDLLFESLTKSLKAKVTPYVARLSSSHCNNVKTAIFHITNSFMNKNEDADFIDSDDEEIILHSPKKRGLKKSQCNMGVLSAWYQDSIKFEGNIMDSPRKKLKKSPGVKSPRKKSTVEVLKSPLIVIIEDVEGIPSHILQDIILICSEYRQSLPFVFVLGVATTPAAIHRYLSQDASSHIAMETFQAQPSSILLSQVIDKVLMSSLPFHLGGKVFKLLLDIFLFHDLSVNNFISGLKFCMLEHFLRGNVSFLCCDRATRKRIMGNLSPACLSSLKEAASVVKFIESLAEKERKLMDGDAYFKEAVLDQVNNLEDWYETFCIMVKSLHQLVYDLPGTPLGKQVRELFSICLSQQVTDTSEFQESWKVLAMSSKEDMMVKIVCVKEILQDFPLNDAAEELNSKLKNYLDSLNNIDVTRSPRKSATTPTKPNSFELKPSDRFHLREKLLGGSKVKVRNRFEELRSEILSTFEHYFISFLKPPHSKHFHEVLFFDMIGSVKYQLLGSLRATITTGLYNPQKYLQCKCCKLEDTSDVLTTLPDLSICYKLHLECGRLINLYDWLQAFIAVLGTNEEVEEEEEFIIKKKKGKIPKKKKKIDEQIQARFIQAVSELQLLGFVKPTKRKTDHVQRLTWGGC